METIRRGNATEAAVLAAFIDRGWQVWTPFGEGSAFDLLVGRGETLLRVQCKTGRQRKGPVSEAARFEGCYRLEPPRNNQRKFIRFAAAYEIDAWDPDELIRRALSTKQS